MRQNRPARRSRRNLFSRLTGRTEGPVRRAPRRREVERLESRQMMAVVGTPTDEPYFKKQWNLDADGQNVEFDPTSPTFGQQLAVAGEDINVIPAWELGLTGQGIQVAIIAGGFDLDHPDLANAFAGQDFTTLLDLLAGDNDPTYDDPTDALGTGLAGIVGARDNGEGIIGIAYGSDIIPIRLDPGQFEAIFPTIDAINRAIRFQAGFIQDGDGDGVADDVLGGSLIQVGLDEEGRPILAQDPSLVTDIFLHSGEFIERQFDADGNLVLQEDRIVDLLPVGFSTENPLQVISIVDAIRETAIGGRARYVDIHADGIISPDEIRSLGSIHIVPAGDDAGRNQVTPPFTPLGDMASSQYNQLANSIYTITVGGVDYDGEFENNATGTFTGQFEGGANVFLVAPTGARDVDLNTFVNRQTGLITTDPAGDDGLNQAPVFNFEFDGDYFADTDYTTAAQGSQYAAAQVAGVVALMLEANPNLSYRDVQQILLMSARQNDQFDESWIVNQLKEFQDNYELPQYYTYNLDTDGDGTADIENAIIPNPEYNPLLQDFLAERGFFANRNANVDLGAPFVYAPLPVGFFDGLTGPYGYDLPQFAVPNGFLPLDGEDASLFADPMDDSLYGRATLDENGVAVPSDDPDALPVVLTRVRTVFMEMEGGDPIEMQEEIAVLLYDANGNLVRPNAPAVDDEDTLIFGDPPPDAMEGEMGEQVFEAAPGSLPLNGLNLAGKNVSIVGGNFPVPDFVGDPDPDLSPDWLNIFRSGAPNPVIVFQEDTIPDNAGFLPVISPITDFFQTVPLEFENGAGYTVSQGYGNSLEDVTYGHGYLDAELAVQLAQAWETNDLYLDNQVSITSSILGGTASVRLQPAVNITDEDGDLVLTVPGGISLGNINEAFYDEFFSDITTQEIDAGLGDGGGEVITGAPFFDPDGDPPQSQRGPTRIPFRFDPSVLTDFVSIEQIELTTNISGGDVDHLRFAIISPNGTQSELNAMRPPVSDLAPQQPQGQQGRQTPGEESIAPNVGLTPIDGAGDFINGSVTNQVVATDQTDPLPNGQGYTWTTNRHWGELISLQANAEVDDDGPNAGISPSDEWFLIVENHGFGAVTVGGQFEITVHGTRATGNRIQGKIGIDDNKQGIDGTEADENFNFNRYIDLGGVSVTMIDTSDPEYTPETAQDFIVEFDTSVVVDDPTDSVTYSNTQTPAENEFSLDGIYKTVAPDTGVELLYPVVSQDDYFSDVVTDDFAAAIEKFFRVTTGNEGLVLNTVTSFTSIDRYTTPGDNVAVANAVNSGFYGELPGDFRADSFSYRNFDYSQESFAAGVTVLATQYEVQYDVNGVAVSRTPTGKVQRFTTGADGNYYFDVEANPEPPVPGTPAYLSWFNDVGATLEYEISLDGVDNDRILTNEDEGGIGYFDQPEVGVVGFDASQKLYNVGINDAENIAQGVTSQIKSLNFLLKVDPALTNAETSGVVYRDRNGDGLQQVGPEEGFEGVRVFRDVNRNGSFDAGEPFELTDSTGSYSLVVSGLFSPQEVNIVVDQTTLPEGFVTTSPASGVQAVTATPGEAVDADFGLQLEIGEPAQVLGLVYNDLDQDGTRDPGEPGIGASTPVRIYIDANNNGSYDAGEPAGVTRDDGSFVIESDITGTRQVRFDTESTPLLQTGPADGAGITVNLVDGQTIAGVEFGAFDARDSDFGDLFVDPDFGVSGARYPTLLSDNGARHVVIPGMSLGALVDIDDNGFQQPTRGENTFNPNDGLGDDLDGVDDEDGVLLVSQTIAPNSTIEFDIVANGGGAVLNAWIDFNADGDWDDPGEQVFTDVEDLGTGEAIRLVANTPAAVSTRADAYAARFRWGPFGLSYDGAANAGEVEDYLLPRRSAAQVAALAADYNGDQVVDEADGQYWRVNYGSTTILGADGNGNGRVDAADFTIWRDAYEQSQLAFAATTGPAPSRVVDLTHLPLSPANVPRPVTMPVEDFQQQPLLATASSLMLLPSGGSSAVDESLADAPVADGATDADSIDSALLLLSVDDTPDGDPAPVGPEEFYGEAAEEDESEELALEEAFAV
ncbi:S8 family serine peptidase [Botrimarina sp.]|uniref:S8 family serine peptidase n=1 Tax=Botrimarina sp. TaxID=2795802 RepID=UPI0032EF3FD0